MDKVLKSKRLDGIGEYYFSQKLRQIEELNKSGRKIINLGIGNPDMEPPEEVKQALINGLSNEGFHKYQSYKGIPALRQAFADWYTKYYEVTLDPEREILPLIGSKEGIMHCSMAFLHEGDEALVPNPGYPSYASAVKMSGATPVYYHLTEENGYLPNLEELESLVNRNTKVMWVNYPHMPTGTPYHDDLKQLIAFCNEHKIVLINDNPYSFILTEEPTSLLAHCSSEDLVLELNSLSKSHNMQGWRVDFDYINTLDLQMVAGRAFDPTITTDSTAIIINESALAVTGLDAQSILGKRIFNGIGEDGTTVFTVIGVVKNFHFESMRNNVKPLSLQIGRSNGNLVVKLKSGDFSTALKQLQELWDARSPSLAFDYQFMDASFNQVYENEKRLGNIFVIFTSLSIFIACLGLFGLAAFNAQKRVKEIGVRKVLGASVGQITYRLSFDFLKLVFIAVLISLPIGWFAMNRWLEDFTFRINIGPWEFLIATFIAVLIALLTVSYQSIKAALANPVKSLRTE